MHRRLLLPVLLITVVAALSAAPAAQLTLSLTEIEEALRIGTTRIAADRARFHSSYRIPVAHPPVDYVEVVTPFRRVVLAADQHAQAGDRSFGQRQALQLLTDADGQFDFVVEFTFHPLNTFVGMPDFEVDLMRGPGQIAPSSSDRQPRYGARVDGLPPAIPLPGSQIRGAPSQPILGGTITARFRGTDVNAMGAQDLVVRDKGQELVRVRVDLARLR